MRGTLFIIIASVVFAIISVMLWLRERRTVTELKAQMDEFWAVKERRKFVRIPTKLNVSCKILEKADGRWLAFTKDISGEGICILSPEILSKDSSIELAINLPGENKPITAKGEVVWVKELTQSDSSNAKRMFSTGIRFTHIDLPSKNKLLHYIQENLKKQTASRI